MTLTSQNDSSLHLSARESLTGDDIFHVSRLGVLDRGPSTTPLPRLYWSLRMQLSIALQVSPVSLQRAEGGKSEGKVDLS